MQAYGNDGTNDPLPFFRGRSESRACRVRLPRSSPCADLQNCVAPTRGKFQLCGIGRGTRVESSLFPLAK